MANGDLPAGGVTVLREGPVASGASRAFFGMADFGRRLKNLADPAQGNAHVPP